MWIKFTCRKRLFSWRLLRKSNILFKKCAPLCDFWPPLLQNPGEGVWAFRAIFVKHLWHHSICLWKSGKVIETQVCDIFLSRLYEINKKQAPGWLDYLLAWAGLRIPKETLAHQLHIFWIKKKNYETQRILRKIDTVVGVGETQIFSNVALQRVLSSVCVWLLQSHAVS